MVEHIGGGDLQRTAHDALGSDELLLDEGDDVRVVHFLARGEAQDEMVAEAGLRQGQAVAVGDLAAGRGDLEIHRARVGAGIPRRLDGLGHARAALIGNGAQVSRGGRRLLCPREPGAKSQTQHRADTQRAENLHRWQI